MAERPTQSQYDASGIIPPFMAERIRAHRESQEGVTVSDQVEASTDTGEEYDVETVIEQVTTPLAGLRATLQNELNQQGEK